MLLVPQPTLIILSILGYLSLYFTAPVIVSLAVLWGWFDYSSKSQRRVVLVLRQLNNLIDDFGRLNFQQGDATDDSRIVKLLDKVTFAPETFTSPQVASAMIDMVKEVYFTFQLWYFSMRHKVQVLLRKAGALIEYDLVEVANEFIELYSDFVEKIAEATLHIIAKGQMASLESERDHFATFTTQLSELRGRCNALLKSLQDDGLPISGVEVRALEMDPWIKPRDET
jgi:hypothetical protein